MKALLLKQTAPIEDRPIELADVTEPRPGEKQVKIDVQFCGVCHTDLHIVEGDLEVPRLPLIPGHQIIGRVEELGKGVEKFSVGDRVGVPWLYSTCGECEFCRNHQENLCENIRFTGLDADGGFAEKTVSEEDFTYQIPGGLSSEKVSPLLCGGVIGYRALELSGAGEGDNLGLYGFGSSAHMVIQMARYRGSQVYVFTRSEEHRKLDRELGGRWEGSDKDDPPRKMDTSIIFAPAGWIVPEALRVAKKGGKVVTAGIHMSPIPEFTYDLLWGERTLTSVANSTRRDVKELLKLSEEIPIETTVETYPLEEGPEVLEKLKKSEIEASAVLKI